MTCTWEGCTEEASRPQIGQDGQQWANLCPKHDERLHQAIADVDQPHRMIGYWVTAQGGARAATDRLKPQVNTATRLAKLLFAR